jgi:hypothetical protein
MNRQEKLIEDLSQEIVALIDTRTLDAGLSRREASQTCREIATELRDRADGLESEAEADGE